MSAAEKLRALQEAPYPHRVPSVMDALPQIVALVEAAEAYVRADKEYQRRIDTIDIRDTLSALDEALGA